MWCSACQQDVPRVATSAEDSTVCCARCGRALPVPTTSDARHVPFEDLPEFPELIELDDWEFSEAIQDAERIVRNVTSDLDGLEQNHDAWSRRGIPKSISSARGVAPENNRDNDALTSATWPVPSLVLAVALGVFVCGAALIILSLVNQRPQLWQLGVPFALSGQVAVLSVVFWQLNAVWNNNRTTLAALHAADKQLQRLHNDWSALQQQDSEAFYQHLAQGANPEVLLADLKDQLDLLSNHLARSKRAA